jgi:hypothetical protein
VVRIHAGEPVVLVRKLSPPLFNTLWVLDWHFCPKWRVRARFGVSAENSATAKRALLLLCRAELAESLRCGCQASPLFNSLDCNHISASRCWRIFHYSFLVNLGGLPAANMASAHKGVRRSRIFKCSPFPPSMYLSRRHSRPWFVLYSCPGLSLGLCPPRVEHQPGMWKDTSFRASRHRPGTFYELIALGFLSADSRTVIDLTCDQASFARPRLSQTSTE